MAYGKTSSSDEILSSDSKEGVSSLGKVAGVCEVSASTVARKQVGKGDAWAFSTGTIITLAKKNAADGFKCPKMS